MPNIIIWWLITLSMSSVFASPNIRFKQLWLEDGLPSKTVRAVTQDNNGFIWLGTSNGVVQFDGFEIAPIDIINQTSFASKELYVTSLLVDTDNRLWIGTMYQGLFIYDIEKRHITRLNLDLNRNENSGEEPFRVFSISHDQNKITWVATDHGLFLIDSSLKTTAQVNSNEFSIDSNEVISVLPVGNGQTYLSVNNELFLFDVDSKNLEKIVFSNGEFESRINVIANGTGNSIWLGTSTGLVHYNRTTKKWNKFNDQIDDQVLSIIEDSLGTVWVGTLLSGLFSIDVNGDTNQYQYSKGDASSLSDNSVWALYQDYSNSIWVGTFNAGAHYFDRLSLQFGLHLDDSMGVKCLPSRIIYSVYEDYDQSLWMGTSLGLTHFNETTGQCQTFKNNPLDKKSLPKSSVLSVFRDSTKTLWVGLGAGLVEFVEIKNEFKPAPYPLDKKMIYDAHHLDEHNVLLAAKSGLFQMNFESRQVHDVAIEPKDLKGESFSKILSNNKENFWLASDKGLAVYSYQDKSVRYFTINGQPFIKEKVGGIYLSADEQLWVAVNKVGVYRIKLADETFKLFTVSDGLSTIDYFAGIVSDTTNKIWIATSKGLSRYDSLTHQFEQFHLSDGLQSQSFTRGAILSLSNGKLFMGGRRGFNLFEPNTIAKNTVAPKTIISDYFYLNDKRKQSANNTFLSSKSIRFKNEITLTYKDKLFGLGFSSMHYSEPSENRFAYKLEGLNDDWIYTDAKNRRITYSNLDSGQYVFKVKSANKDEVWSHDEVKLIINVEPAPWKTWWAYCLYFITLIVLIFSYVRYKTASSRKKALMLEYEVAEKTKQLVEKNKTIELLLKHKNKIFANISHEFRTPLTLILGPISKLKKSLSHSSELNQLDVVKRNAGRLLSLVDQLLKLSEVYQEEPSPKSTQNLIEKLKLIVDSFEVVASLKNIVLKLTYECGYQVLLTDDAIETIIGNLISNAIKYSPNHSEVVINVVQCEQHLLIQVIDHGAGIPNELQGTVFKRFTRLEEHSDIQGTGLGLSLVKEITEINGGEVSLTSQQGVGSTFVVKLPFKEKIPLLPDAQPGVKINEVKVNKSNQPDSGSTKSVVDKGETKAELSSEVNLIQSNDDNLDKKLNTVLIIEDNKDMSQYIKDVFDENFNCIVAFDGDEGIRKAMEVIPDAIVSDIMMPKKDGFEVAKHLREDERTSHIPLILLTARHDIESRMIGWREEVDDYLTKPFESEELLLRVNRVIAIRNRLKQKYGNVLQDKQTLTELPKKEQEFIERLNKVIDENYKDQNFSRGEMASQMAISERQLQRKLKALIDYNPSDYLRDFRLEKSLQGLQDGYQVSVVAHECGFNTPTYYSRCFKLKYGMSPNQYKSKPN